jgi:hypothetical protein
LLVHGALCLTVLVAAAGAPSALADYAIRLDTGPAPELAGRHIGTYRQAVRAFGRARLVARETATHPTCAAAWPLLGLQIDFSTSRTGACALTDLGSWLEVRATAARWHTSAGLRVGAAEQRLHSLYPDARRLSFLGRGPLWELETGGPLCDGGPPLALAGRVEESRVTALAVVHVPACG